MRYYVGDHTLFIRGRFRAASTGIGGGIRDVTTVLNHTVPRDFDHDDPARYLDMLVARCGLSQDYFGLLTAVDVRNLCVLQYDFIMVFVTAGVTNPNPPPAPQTINIVVYSRERISDAALLETIVTATEAKAQALHGMGYSFSGTTTDAVCVACEGDAAPAHIYAGTLTEVGRRVYAAVLHGVPQALKRQEGEIERTTPSFFIYSRYGGEHWVEWQKKDCPYYPCHFPGQSCDFCYCPYYPCEDEELGEWVESSSGGTVWGCARCTLLHIPEIAEYVKRNPEASLSELKRLRDRLTV
jgi:adenosylcobinamide hydrolase